MDNPLLLVVGKNIALLKDALSIAFKQHDCVTVSGWKEVPNVGLVIYWGNPESSQSFGPSGVNPDILSQQISPWLEYLNYEYYIGCPNDIDGDTERGWMVYHPDSIDTPLDIPDKFNVVCVIKPHYIYYGK
jgi:hypothetical protein